MRNDIHLIVHWTADAQEKLPDSHHRHRSVELGTTSVTEDDMIKRIKSDIAFTNSRKQLNKKIENFLTDEIGQTKR